MIQIGSYKKPVFQKINGCNNDIIKAIHAALPDSIRQTKNIALLFKGKNEYETCQNLFNYLLTKVRYQADQGTQIIKTPSALMREKIGDCKSISLFIAAVLDNLKIPYYFTYASYNNSITPSHVYITTKNGIIIDPVYKQFNKEKQATHKIYKK